MKTNIKSIIKKAEQNLNDSEYIKNKAEALAICKLLIDNCLVNSEKMVENSIGHKLGLRLMDYIRRN